MKSIQTNDLSNFWSEILISSRSQIICPCLSKTNQLKICDSIMVKVWFGLNSEATWSGFGKRNRALSENEILVEVCQFYSNNHSCHLEIMALLSCYYSSLTTLLFLPHSCAGHPSLPSLLCGPGGASRTLSRAVSCRPAEDREISMINNYNYWQTCQLLCGNGHLWFMVL